MSIKCLVKKKIIELFHVVQARAESPKAPSPGHRPGYDGNQHDARAHGAPVVVDEDVAHDGEDPALEVDVVDKFVLIVKHLQRCILQQVVGVITVRRKQICEVKHISLNRQQLVL